MTVAIRVDPGAQKVLDQIAEHTPPQMPGKEPSEAERVASVRQAYAGAAEMAGPPEPVAHVENRTVKGPDGAIPVRIYRPRPAVAGTPVLIWLHGGSFISGNLDTHDTPLRAVANRAGLPVIAVAWRLAPEHLYPAGLEDAYAVLTWAVRNGEPLGIDPSRVAIGGDSAGGALAAALTFLARERTGPAIAAQVLIYPNTDLMADGGGHLSWTQNDGRVLSRHEMERNVALYVGDADRSAPTISPLHASDLSGQPPALIITGEADPLRDEGEAYSERLRAVGVRVEAVRYPGMIHGFFQMAGVLPAGRDAIDRVGDWLARTLIHPKEVTVGEEDW